jgi:SAM-dependent methyltransferase
MLAGESDAEARYEAQRHRTARRRDHVERKWTERLAWILPCLRPGASLLDVGCAEGEFGALLRAKFDVRVHGVEPSLDALEAASKLDAVHHGPLRTAPLFLHDVVVAFHVLEHVVDIDAFLRDVDARLGPEGAFYVEVPREAGHPWLDVDPNIEHIHRFSAASLVTCLERNGWIVVSLASGGFESPMYADSLRVEARRRAHDGLGRARRVAALRRIAGHTGLIVYGLGGDFRGYVSDLLDDVTVIAFVDRDPSTAKALEVQPDAQLLTAAELSTLPSDAPVLIATYRFEEEVRAELEAIGIAPERLFGMDALFER